MTQRVEFVIQADFETDEEYENFADMLAQKGVQILNEEDVVINEASDPDNLVRPARKLKSGG